MTYLRYAPDIERPAPDEQETIHGIIETAHPVATLRLPRQDAYGPDRVRDFDEVMTFRLDGRAVAEAPVVALPVRGGRVVDLEEELQDAPVTRPGRIEDDLDAFGMRPVVSIGGIRHVATRVPLSPIASDGFVRHWPTLASAGLDRSSRPIADGRFGPCM